MKDLVFMTIKQVSAKYGIPRYIIDKAVHDGEISYHNFGTRTNYISEENFVIWVERHRQDEARGYKIIKSSRDCEEITPISIRRRRRA